MITITERLVELGIDLPPPIPGPPDHAAMVQTRKPRVRRRATARSTRERRPVYKGRLGAELTEETGYAAARLSALNVLATLAVGLDGLDAVQRLVRVTGFVNATPEFERHPWVVNGASDVFSAVFEGRGGHARTTMGVAGLPLGMACAIETVFEVA